LKVENNLNFHYSGNMEIISTPAASTLTNTNAVQMLAALAQEVRLSIFRLLVQAGPQGLPAGKISQILAIPASTLSFHLAHLSKVGLINAQTAGRQIIYSPNFARMQLLTDYLLANCCQGETCVVSPTQTSVASTCGGKKMPPTVPVK
jgi:ArsR family transcriptional regulator